MVDDVAQNGRVRDERIKNLSDDILEQKKNIKTVAEEVVALRIEVARLTERMALFQIAQGIFTVIATGIAIYMAYAVK